MLREASHPSSARAEEVDKFSGGTVGDKNLRHHRPPSSAESTVSDHHLSLCKTWLMYAKPPSELNLDPVTCQAGFAAVLCIMQTTIAAEMRDHDSWRGSRQSPAGPWTGQMRCGRDEGPDPAEVCASQSTGDQGGMEETRRLSRLGSGLRSCGETLIGIRGRWAEHGLALCRRPSWALRHACDDRQITQPPRLPERASTLGGEQVKSNPGKVGGEKCQIMDATQWTPDLGTPEWPGAKSRTC